MTVSTFQAPAMVPSFPPVDDLLRAIRKIDWPVVADRLLTFALTIAAIAHVAFIRVRPHVATLLRKLADRLAPEQASSLDSLTVAELRKLAREQGIPRSRYFAARKADLIKALR